MRVKDNLQLTIFILILLAILVIYFITLYRITEVENYLQLNNSIEVSDEFKYLKDFSDRNVKVFILQTTLLFTILATVIAVFVRYEFVRIVDKVEHKVDNFIKGQNIINTDFNTKYTDLSDDLLTNESSTFYRLSGLRPERPLRINWIFLSLNSLFKKTTLTDIDKESIKEYIIECRDNLLPDYEIEKNELIENTMVDILVRCPEEFRSDLSNVIIDYKSKITHTLFEEKNSVISGPKQ